jgi:DNA-binding response OmpR family regulator
LPGPHAPIIVLTAADATTYAADVGAAGYLTKPFDIDELLAVVDGV